MEMTMTMLILMAIVDDLGADVNCDDHFDRNDDDDDYDYYY